MKKNHSRVLCEVCGDRLRHGLSTTVGHGPNHVRRAICNKPKCQRTWKYESAKYIARWPENKAQVLAASQVSPTESKHMQKRRYITTGGIAWLASKVWAPGTRRSKGWAAEIAREAKRLMPKDFPSELSSIHHRISQLVDGGPPAGMELRYDADAQCEVVRRVGDHKPETVVAAPAVAEPAPEAPATAPAGELKFVVDKVRPGFDDALEDLFTSSKRRIGPRATALGNIIVDCVGFLQESGDVDTLKVLAALASEKLTK